MHCTLQDKYCSMKRDVCWVAGDKHFLRESPREGSSLASVRARVRAAVADFPHLVTWEWGTRRAPPRASAALSTVLRACAGGGSLGALVPGRHCGSPRGMLLPLHTSS